MTQRKLTIIDHLGFIMSALCGLIALTVLGLWAHSQGNFASCRIPGPGLGALAMISEDGRLIVGVVTDESGRARWGRPMRMKLSDLQNDPDRYVMADMWSFGVALPHLLVAAAVLVPPAWWFIVYRERNERQRRITHGLCRHCGYDIRFSRGRCPECGNLVADRDEPDEALPPPPLPTQTNV